MTGDEIVKAAQNHIIKYGPHKFGFEIQQLMDAVADVGGYKMDSSCDQGYIKRKFMSERIEANHVVDFDILISKFWTGVFQYVMKALPIGSDVSVRNVDIGISEVEVEKKYGRTYSVRATNMSPISFLRSQGVASARKYINSCYQRRLRQQCNDCGNISPIGSIKEFDYGCNECGSTESVIVARVMRRRERRCVGCGHLRPAIIKRACGRENEHGEVINGCGSVDVSLVQAEEFISDDTDKQESIFEEQVDDSEAMFVDRELEKDVQSFLHECLKRMPVDINDPNKDSQGRKILRILVDPRAGVDICNGCNDRAPKICPEKCKTECEHDKIPDPKVCCGGGVFNLNRCVNYSKRIGEHFGYTASLANRRIAKVREFVMKFAESNKRQFACASYIAERIKKTNS